MLVTVIIPTYKRIDYLREAVQSVVDQTYTNFECLVVNDYPPFKDQIQDLIDSFQDERVRVIHHEQNGGESQARNTAIPEAKGEIIGLLDDDDIWLENFLAEHVKKHQERPDAGLVYSGLHKFWDNDFMAPRTYTGETPPPAEKLTEAWLQGDFCLASSSIVSLKRVCFEECGIFDTSLPSFADWDMWCRISHKYAFAHIEAPLIRYRYHLGVRGSTDMGKRMKGIEVLSAKWSHREEFRGFEDGLRVNAYMSEIRNNILMGDRKKGAQLLMECIRKYGAESIRHFDEILFSGFIVMAGKFYPDIQKMIHGGKAKATT
ncbi:MAG: glycosyltransferase family 2 protein [Bacteroidota bacterium]